MMGGGFLRMPGCFIPQQHHTRSYHAAQQPWWGAPCLQQLLLLVWARVQAALLVLWTRTASAMHGNVSPLHEATCLHAATSSGHRHQALQLQWHAQRLQLLLPASPMPERAQASPLQRWIRRLAVVS